MADKPTFRSPNEILEAAKEIMLEGREPESVRDWHLVANFVAVNVHPGVGAAALKLFLRIYDAPVTEADAEEIWNFHINRNRR